MRVWIGDYDVCDPAKQLWGLKGYTHALVIVKRHGRPIDAIFFPINSKRAWLPQEEIEESIALRMDIVPSLRCDLLTALEPGRSGNWEPISVVLCTRDRPVALQHCLQSLMHLDYPEWEVVVVDNASRSDETRALVSQTPFRYVREDRPGLDWARNCGFGSTKFDIVAFTDDDVIVDPLWLEGINRGFQIEKAGAVTGNVLPAEIETPAQSIFEGTYDGMSKGFQMRIFSPQRLPAQSLLATQHIGVGANMAYRKSVLRELGGFDTALDVGTPAFGAGDLDMFHRVLSAGHLICYEPTALVRHHHRRRMSDLYRQMYMNGRSYGTYLIKRFLEASPSRLYVLRFTFCKWVPWLIGRCLMRLVRRHPLPMRMLLEELRGAFESPYAYVATKRNDVRLRKAR